MSDRDRLAALHARGRPASAAPVRMGVVTAVDTGDGEATVELTDGTTTVIYATGGYLPAVGDQVPLLANGGDPISLVPRHMVDGDLQSRSFQEGSAGWRIEANGDAEFNDVVVRGDVTANAFNTSADPATDGGLRVSSEYGPAAFVFYVENGGVAEDDPALISAYKLGAERSIAVQSAGAVPAEVRLVDTGSGTTATIGAGRIDFAAVGGGHVTANGVSLTAPPHIRGARSTNVSITPSTATSVIVDGTTLHNLQPDGTNSVDVNLTTGAFTPKVPGLWRVEIEGVWEASGTYDAQVGYRLNGSTDVWGPPVVVNAFLNYNTATLTRMVAVNGTSDVFVPRARHLSGASRAFSLTRVSFSYWGTV